MTAAGDTARRRLIKIANATEQRGLFGVWWEMGKDSGTELRLACARVISPATRCESDNTNPPPHFHPQADINQPFSLLFVFFLVSGP